MFEKRYYRRTPRQAAELLRRGGSACGS